MSKYPRLITSIVCILSFLLLSSTQVEAVEPLGQGSGWNLVFSDEFDGSTLNLSKWEPSWFTGINISPPINDREDGCYDPVQVSVGGGNLALTAVATTKTNCYLKGGKTRAYYASGLVNTRKSFLNAYGFYEARIYLPGNNGLINNWPAFWTDGTGSWPSTGEIDVMEGLSDHHPCWHYHYLDSKSQHQGPGGCVNWDGTGWHTYAAYWEPGLITYYYDGLKVGTIDVGVISDVHYIILNYGVNDEYGIYVPSTMLVDYVRVWKKASSTPDPTSTASPIPTLIGNTDGDSDVDEQDFAAWLSEFFNLPPLPKADFNQDSKVDGIDFVLWLNNYTG